MKAEQAETKLVKARLRGRSAVSAAAARPGRQSRQRAEISLFTEEGVCVASRVRTAAGFVSRLVGLLNCCYLGEHEGLLLKPGGSVHTFGMRFGIDVLFLDREMRIVKVVRRLQPWHLALAPRATTAVLEIASGRAAALGLRGAMRLIRQTATRQRSSCA